MREIIQRPIVRTRLAQIDQTMNSLAAFGENLQAQRKNSAKNTTSVAGVARENVPQADTATSDPPVVTE